MINSLKEKETELETIHKLSYEDEIINLSNEELEEYREIFQDVLALRGDFRLFYTPDKELSDAIYDIAEPLDALFKALKRIVVVQKNEQENNKNWLQKSELSCI